MLFWDTEDLYQKCIDEETGEFNEEMFNRLQNDQTEKQENIAMYCVETSALIEAIRKEEKKLKTKRELLEGQLKNRKAFLQEILQGKKLKSSRVSVSYRKSTRTVITDESKIPEYLFNVKEEVVPDLNRIAKAIDSGLFVEGAKREEHVNVIIK